MRRISPAQRVDTLKSEQRLRRPGRLGRVIYVALLVLFFVYVLDLIFGSLFYLSAGGMLMRDSATLSRDYTGTVATVDTVEGATVLANTQLVRLESLEITSLIAERTLELGRLEAELSDREGRRATVLDLIPEAKTRRDMLHQSMKDIQLLRADGLASNAREANAVDDFYAADRDLALLHEELVQIDRETLRLAEFVTSAAETLNRLRESYDDGRIVAPVAGTVGELSVTPGEVIDRGASILRIFHGDTYVMAYVPPGRLFDLEIGQKVMIRAGFLQIPGRIETVFPIAPTLPPEFSLAFDTSNRQQLIRVKLDVPPPLQCRFSQPQRSPTAGTCDPWLPEPWHSGGRLSLRAL